jgi:AraC-like DNA-binding protein
VRRLQRCYDKLAAPEHATLSITEIAYSLGFNSSSHFSNLFRAQFGVRPSDVRGSSVEACLPRKTSLLVDGAAS